MTMDTVGPDLMRAAVETIGGAPAGTPDEELLPKLMAIGIPRDEARLLLVFVPVAFGRPVLMRMGVTHFSGHAHILSTGPAIFAAVTYIGAECRSGRREGTKAWKQNRRRQYRVAAP